MLHIRKELLARISPDFPLFFTPERCPWIQDQHSQKTVCQLHFAIEPLASGKTYRQVEEMTGISKSTLIRAQKRA